MNICSYLLTGKPRDATALLTLNGRYSFGDLEDAALHIAHLLTRSGGRKGDRAVLLANSGFFWVAAYLGTIRAGLACVPLPPRTSPGELEYVVDATEPVVAFVESQMLASVEAQLR